MKHEITVDWLEDLKFDAHVENFSFVLDGNPQSGDDRAGVRPKPLMLVALAGCSGMDVVNLLKKMRVDYKKIEIKAEGTLTDTVPAVYSAIHLIYIVTGTALPMSKITKAVALSYEKYCGVATMYKQFLPVTYEIKIIEG